MEIKVPEIGESIYEAVIAQWYKNDGDYVYKDDLLCELETDKINLEIQAEEEGRLKTLAADEATVKIGAVIGEIVASEAPPASEAKKETETTASTTDPAGGIVAVNPAAQRLADEKGIDPQLVAGSGRNGRVLRDDIVATAALPKAKETEISASSDQDKLPQATKTDDPRIRRVKMTPIRRKIAQTLLQARQQTAMLTTFNEADLGRVISLRKKFNEHFENKHGVKLGFMSFFVKATIRALQEVPEVNARIDGEDIVYHDYFNIGIAVGTEKGLVVPVLREADTMTFSDIEKAIGSYGDRAKNGKLQLSDLTGGTFTLTNGGIYGSLMSTPILNPPQSGILGMHAIKKRPVVIDDEIRIRPMMYLALSYDHRIIDGKQAVTFLNIIKENIEAPEEMLLEM